MGHIYLIRNLVNGKGYVGQTTNTVIRRWKRHKSDAKRGHHCAIHSAIRKYGAGSFIIKEVARCEDSLLNKLERLFIKFYGTYAPTGHGYNETEGGEGSIGFHHSDETKTKMSIAGKRRGFPAEATAKARLVNKGNQYLKGRILSEEHKAKISSTLKGTRGHPQSEETKHRIAAKAKGRKQSAEVIAKRVAATATKEAKKAKEVIS